MSASWLRFHPLNPKPFQNHMCILHFVFISLFCYCDYSFLSLCGCFWRFGSLLLLLMTHNHPERLELGCKPLCACFVWTPECRILASSDFFLFLILGKVTPLFRCCTFSHRSHLLFQTPSVQTPAWRSESCYVCGWLHRGGGQIYRGGFRGLLEGSVFWNIFWMWIFLCCV